MRKTIKENATVDHLADNTVKDCKPLDFDFSNENLLTIKEEENKSNRWTTFFDGTVNVYGNEANE